MTLLPYWLVSVCAAWLGSGWSPPNPSLKCIFLYLSYFPCVCILSFPSIVLIDLFMIMHFPSNVLLSGPVSFQSWGGYLFAARRGLGRWEEEKGFWHSGAGGMGVWAMEGGHTCSVQVWFLPAPGPGESEPWGNPHSLPLGSPLLTFTIPQHTSPSASVTGHLPIPSCPNPVRAISHSQFFFSSSYQRPSSIPSHPTLYLLPQEATLTPYCQIHCSPRLHASDLELT